MDCPDANVVQGLILGRLAPSEQRATAAHVESCASCQQLLDALASGAPITGPGPAPPAPGARAEMPARVERYQLRDRLGEGGMGIVYRAYDPELHREIALKVLSPAAAQGDPTGGTQARLLREAQAMARVAHPNVIAVYDVGTVDSRVFVAMELATNGTLRRWQRGRTWREVVSAYVAAGRGLAAAHAAGIVHRDFKPDNVLIGADGRIRVTDFGLARADRAYPGSDVQPSGMLDVALTVTGMVIGTPAYMAPEQLDSAPTDARTDQFAFCVALWEALHGVRPFVGHGVHDVRAAIAAHALTRGPAPATPPRIVAALERGLAAEPAARWPTMTTLLDELERASRSRRSAYVAIGAVAAFALVVAAAVAGSARESAVAHGRTAPGAASGSMVTTTTGAALPASERPAAADTVPTPRAGCITELTPHPPAGDLVLARACGAVTVDGAVTIDATLTIEPGVVVRFKDDASLYIGWSRRGRLVARGTADAPIVLTAAGEQTPGIWDGVHLGSNADGSTLAWVQIAYAGSVKQNPSNPAALVVEAERITLDHVTFSDGGGFGVVAVNRSPSFARPVAGCEFRALARGAMQLHPAQLVGVARDNTLDDAAAIELIAGEIRHDTRMHAGVRYRLMGNVGVERAQSEPATPTLTIEGGATIEGTNGRSLYVGYGATGTLKAIGAPDRPVRFTSVDRRKATWSGVRFYDQARDSTIAHAVVEFANPGDGGGAIAIDRGAEVALWNVAFAHLDGVGLSARKDPHVSFASLTGADVAAVQQITE